MKSGGANPSGLRGDSRVGGGLSYGRLLGAHRTSGCALSLAGREREGSASAGAQGEQSITAWHPPRGRWQLHPCFLHRVLRGLGSTVVSTSPQVQCQAGLGLGLPGWGWAQCSQPPPEARASGQRSRPEPGVMPIPASSCSVLRALQGPTEAPQGSAPAIAPLCMPPVRMT